MIKHAPAWLARLSAMAAGLLCAGASSAMTFMPTQIIQCPGSNEVRQLLQLGSGNTFGAKVWTDGYIEAPMLPHVPIITRCEKGGPIFWVSSAEVVGEVPWGAEEGQAAVPKAWEGAEIVHHLSAEEYLQAIDQGLGDTPERLLYLRKWAWWKASHAWRPTSHAPRPAVASDFAPGTAARANLEALVTALDASQDDQRLLKSEGLRQLGRFDEAAALLADGDRFQRPHLRALDAAIRERIAARDARVAKLKPER